MNVEGRVKKLRIIIDENIHYEGSLLYEAVIQKGRPILQSGTWEGLTYTFLDSRKGLGVMAEIYKLIPSLE